MIAFIQKLIFILKKKNHLTQVRCERNYVLTNFKDKISLNEDIMREELGVLKTKKKPTVEEKESINKIEGKLNEAQHYKQMLTRSDQTELELIGIIKATKKFLWKKS